MKILVVLAVAAVFALLRFRRANLLLWAGAWWVGIYVLAPIRIHCPDSLLRHLDLHGNRLGCDPGVRVLQPGAPRRSLPPARPVHDGEAVHSAPRRNGRRHPGARGRERLRPDERSPPASALLADGPSCIADRDHGSRQEDRSRRGREPLPASRDVESGRVPQACRERAPGLLSELRLLPWRQHGRQRHVRARRWTRSRPIFADETIPHAARDVSLLANFQGRPRASRGRRSLGHGHARLGEVPEGRRDLGRDPLSLRFHRPEASRQGGGRDE